MTLISLILVLGLERIFGKSRTWDASKYVDHYYDWLDRQTRDSGHSDSWWYWGALLAPVLGLYLLLQIIDSGFLQFVIATLVLFLCIGCPRNRELYKHYLQAANRGDMQACSLYEEQLEAVHSGSRSFGENLVWVNYQYYAAVVIWFAVFGAPGVILYTLAREFYYRLARQQHALTSQSSFALAILDWVPVRVTALGFLLVGHFSRALPVWLGYFVDPSVSAKTLLAEVSKAAEDIEVTESDRTEEPCTLVKLAKRNILFILVVISILTLTGWVA